MYGDGSVYFSTSKQKWIYAFFDAEGKKRRKVCSTEREAKALKKKLRIEKNDIKLSGNQLPTVGEWVLDFLNTYQKPKLRETSFKRQIQSAAKIGPIAGIPLDKITGTDIQSLYNSYAGSLSSSSIKKIHQLLFAAYKKAIALRMLEYTPMSAVEPVKTESKKIEIFTFSEILRLFRVLRRDQYYEKYHDLFYIALTTGCRIGELLALKPCDVSIDNREIHIERSKANLKGEIFTKPKTKAGDRHIPIIFDKSLSILSSLKHNDKFIFSTSTGTAYAYNNVRKIWIRICKTADISKNIHAFRHTFCTVALAKGIPLLEVSRIAGHADASTTLKMYGHAIPGYNRKIIQMFSKQRVKNITKK